MLADAPDHDFLHYLMCDLPLGYPLKTSISRLLSPSLTIASRRELLHQQSRFIDLAQPYVNTHPWIAYLAAIKHEAVFIAIPTFDVQLVDMVDKLFFRDLQQKYKELREASRAAIDEATAYYCDRLVLMQSEATQIENATNNVATAIRAGFTALEPLPQPPPEPLPEYRKLPLFISAGAVCLVAAVTLPSYLGDLTWGLIGLIGLIVTGLVGAYVIRKEKARVQAENAKLKAYFLHETYLILCKKSVALVLALPFEIRKTALVDLPQCLTGLQALPPERDALEARYITPFFDK
jgi:hypothetical protein